MKFFMTNKKPFEKFKGNPIYPSKYKKDRRGKNKLGISKRNLGMLGVMSLTRLDTLELSVQVIKRLYGRQLISLSLTISLGNQSETSTVIGTNGIYFHCGM